MCVCARACVHTRARHLVAHVSTPVHVCAAVWLVHLCVSACTCLGAQCTAPCVCISVYTHLYLSVPAWVCVFLCTCMCPCAAVPRHMCGGSASCCGAAEPATPPHALEEFQPSQARAWAALGKRFLLEGMGNVAFYGSAGPSPLTPCQQAQVHSCLLVEQ